MKIKTLLLVTALSASFSTLAAEDCNKNRDPYCGDNGSGNLNKAGELFVLGAVLAAGVGLYFLLKDDEEDLETTARIMADYYKGRGLRLTSYENVFNVSLFTQKPFLLNDPLSNLTDQYKLHQHTYNLLNISVHWQ